MIKVFNATDKNYATHGDLILQPSKAVVHKEDNGDFYLDLETPLNEKEYKNTTPEEGQIVEGTSFSIEVDKTKEEELLSIKGQLEQEKSNNLYGGFNYTITSNGITYTYNTDGTINVSSGTTTSTSYSMLTNAAVSNNYLVKLQSGVYGVLGNEQDIEIQVLSKSGSLLFESTYGMGGGFSISNSQEVFVRLTIPSGKTITAHKINLMLYKGTSATYQPYIQTPDYPLQIETTTGLQNISICGKNYLDLSIFSIASSFYNVSDNNVEVIAGDNRGYTSIENYLILPSGTYTLMSKTQIPRLQITDRNTGTALINVYQKTIQTFTLNETTSIIIKFLNQSGVSYPFTIEKPMIVKGEYSLYNINFEEYKGNNYDINLGTNLLNTNLEMIKSINIGGTWNNNVYTLNGVDFTYNDDGSITATGTASANTNFYFSRSGNYAHTTLPSGTYYFTSHEETGGNSTWKTQFSINGTGYNVFGNGTSKEISKTLTEDTPIYAYIVIYSGKNPNGATFYPMISKSYGIKWYPYKTPIELCKIGNYQDYIKKNSGKNLLPPSIATATQSEITLTNNEDGSYTLNGTATSNYTFSIDLPSTLNGTYSISCNNPQTSSGVSFRILDSNSSSLVSITLSSANTIRENVSITNGTKQAIRVASGTQLTNFILQPMLNEGASALPYEPYGTGQWYIHKEIGKVVLKGASSESWSINGTGTSNWFYWLRYITTNIKTNDRSKTKSNYYPYGNVITSTTDNGLWVSTDNLRIRWGTEDTISNFKTWLSTHNVEVYYILATPTNTLIEDEELINQLNAIQLINGLNNVIVSSANLAGILQLKYNFTRAYSNIIKYIDYLVPNNILVANTPQGDQAFRITNIEKTRRKIKLKANHVFYDSMNYLIADSYVVDKNCNDALDHLNNATDNLSPFTTISNVTHIDSYRCVRKSLYEAVQLVVERWGGHLIRDNWTFGIYDSIGQDNGVTIRYAKNLKEITASYDWDNVVTKLLPVGKDGILLNEIDPAASIYIESAQQYEIPYSKTISFDQSQVDEDNYKDEDGNLDEEAYKQALVDDLYNQGTKYITDSYLPKVNYKLSANVEKVSDVGDTIEVIDEKLGINLMTNIISYDYDCILDKYTQLEFGNFIPTLSNLMTQISVKTDEQIIANNKTLQITLNEELQTATDKIWNALGNSYVIYEGDKILVVDTLPKENATNVIMINNGGIAFSNSGINGTFSSAWTIDNVLNMEQINVINLSANLVKGGTLKLGSTLNQNGQIEVYDETNLLIAELNKNGLKMYGSDGSYVLMNNTVGFAGYDANDEKIYWVDKDQFHMKKSVIEEEITLCSKMRYIPIQIYNGDTLVSDGIGLVSVIGGVE